MHKYADRGTFFICNSQRPESLIPGCPSCSRIQLILYVFKYDMCATAQDCLGKQSEQTEGSDTQVGRILAIQCVKIRGTE